MKAPHETGSEADIGSGRALMPSRLAMHPPKAAFFSFRMQSAFHLNLARFRGTRSHHTPREHTFLSCFFFLNKIIPGSFHVNSTSSPQLKFLNLHYFFYEEWLICIVTKAKILNVMDVYLLSNSLFCRGRSKLQFSPEIRSQITGGSNKKWKNGSIMMLFLHRNW